MILQNRFLSRNVFSLLLDGTGIRRKVFYQISSVVVIIQPDAITRSIPKKKDGCQVLSENHYKMLSNFFANYNTL